MKSIPVRWVYAAIGLIVALRFAVGWHFFRAGAEKLANNNFRASYFLDEAVGPFASLFQGLVPDPFGIDGLNLEQRRARWRARMDKLVAGADNSDAVSQQAEEVLRRHLEKLDYFASLNGPDIEQHWQEVERYQAALSDPNIADVDYGQAWLKQKRAELRWATTGWLTDLTTLERQFHEDLVAELGISASAIPFDGVADKTWVDQAVTWTTLVVGALLLLGLFVPLAGLVGAGFLVCVMLTQPFWVSTADLSYAPYQLVELIALLFLVAVGAGRFGGLDYFLGAARQRRAASN